MPAVDGWYDQVCQKPGHDCLIVIEDLPRLTGTDALSDRLVRLGRVGSRCRCAFHHHQLLPLPVGDPLVERGEARSTH